ncbi:hypothetical protein G3M48_005284 [Beauveria asiatica]|uniref:Uncharacterized protein n=1 Tax=Beauveria asiatica TaxID=1069075 RepID=A0AAW0S7Z2_9HYPO
MSSCALGILRRAPGGTNARASLRSCAFAGTSSLLRALLTTSRIAYRSNLTYNVYTLPSPEQLVNVICNPRCETRHRLLSLRSRTTKSSDQERFTTVPRSRRNIDSTASLVCKQQRSPPFVQHPHSSFYLGAPPNSQSTSSTDKLVLSTRPDAPLLRPATTSTFHRFPFLERAPFCRPLPAASCAAGKKLGRLQSTIEQRTVQTPRPCSPAAGTSPE